MVITLLTELPIFVHLLNKHFLENIRLKKTSLQTITGAMSTLTPPIPLEKPDNQARVDYIQDYASGT